MTSSSSRHTSAAMPKRPNSFPVYKELFGRFGLAALICLLLELLVGLFMRRMP